MRNPKIKYVLCPGTVRSANDGQTHYVGAMTLARLYRVKLDDCEIFEPAQWWPTSYYEMAMEQNKGLIRLAPVSSGDYSLPNPDAATRA